MDLWYPSYKAVIDYIEKAKLEKATSLDLSYAYYLEKDTYNDEDKPVPLRHIPSIVFEIETLQTLNIDRQKIKSIPSTINKLKNLKELSVSGNLLDTFPKEVTELSSLTSLNISSNQVTSLPPEISRLTNLERLDISGNAFANLPMEIFELRNLRHLDVSHMQLDSISESISALKKLEELEAINNNLEMLPTGLCKLLNLTRLDLFNNRIAVIPHEIANLKKLEFLSLTLNRISNLPPEIGELSSLVSLNLSGNTITSLPSEIGNLKKLKRLFLGIYEDSEDNWIPISEMDDEYTRTNEVSKLPVTIRELRQLECLDLIDNPIPVPPEILEKFKHPQRIIEYFFSIQNQKKQLLQSKILVVGQGSVGKTSLIKRIIYNLFDQNQYKTDGIYIDFWTANNQRLEFENSQPQIQLNIWDFGGQEIMHATHQFFLTKRSLYLLVLDSRLMQEENRVEYWLKMIQSFGGESPVLIIGNKIDQHPLDIDRTGLQKKYPNIVGILETSAATGAGIEELKAAITEQVNNLPHVRDLLPETWFTVKTKLEGLGSQSNFITHDKYLELCAENEVSDETSQRTLIGFLHDLGVILHFQDDPRLEALGILNPQWVTNGVYKILNSHNLFQNKGVLTVAMLDEILNLPEYPRGKRLFIVDMMKKFELCYDIEPDKTFLVPDLLPKDQPNLNFNGVPAFEYAYPVLPSSVITRFMVRMNQHIHDGFVWRTGAMLRIRENNALVKADIEDRKITIAIDGLEHTRRDALSAIRYQLDEIHGSIKGLDPQKKIPVPNAPKAEPLKYEYLLKLERAGQESLLVENGNDLVTVNVRKMLSAIETESQRKESGGTVTNIYIGGNVEGSNIVSGNNNVIMQRIQDSFNKAEAADIQVELKATLKQLADAVAVMTKSLPTEQAAEATDDLSKLVDEATKPAPSKKWYSVSIDGLIKAAENLGKVGEPVINLSQKVLSLLTGAIVS